MSDSSQRPLRFRVRVSFYLSLGLLSICATTLVVMASEGELRTRVARVTVPSTDFSRAEPFEWRPAGAATSFARINRDVFSHPSANMSFARQIDFRIGDGLFKKRWVSSPASTKSSDGLGPLYNARSCQSCHLKDGRGRPTALGEKAVSLILRLSIPPRDEDEKSALIAGTEKFIREPTCGSQLQNFSIQGVQAEGEMLVKYEPFTVVLNDTEVVELERPHYSVVDLQYGPFHPEVMMSPRIAPPMIGLGLIEAIPTAEILSFADPHDEDGNGISGRANLVWSERDKQLMVGRFGWKSGEPTVAQQSAHAFALDMGLSTSFESSSSGDCSEIQALCQRAVHGLDPIEGVEVTDQLLALVVFYARHLAVPGRRNIEDPEVRLGKKYFYQLDCIGCHKPKYVTSREAIEPEHRFQLIWPYSDFLLHDMGEGLADGRSEGQATGQEWRTAPLWGIGLTKVIRSDSRYLHDGRARNLLEAILWHGGEAEVSKRRFMAMSEKKRSALLTFLDSL